MRISILVATAALACWSAPLLAQTSDDEGSGLAIGGPNTAPGNDFCHNTSDPVACAVARSKINEALSSGTEISVKVKRREPEKTGP